MAGLPRHPFGVIRLGGAPCEDIRSVHSTPRRRHTPRRTSGCDLGPGLAEDADRDALVVDIEPDVEQGCLLKSLELGNAANEFQVTRLTEASFIVSTPKQLGARHQLRHHWAVHLPPNSSLAVRADEMGALMRCAQVADFP